MSSYHKERYGNFNTGYYSNNRSGSDRRGLIPRPESAEEKAQRLRELGYQAPKLKKIEQSDENEFAKYDLGNKEMPSYESKAEIIDAINSNRVTILTGPTGSGKTTQISQYALEAGFDRIVYLQPRRISTDNTGDRIKQELEAQLGGAMPEKLVGVAHSERSTHSDETRILSLTSGTFTKMLPGFLEKWPEEKVLIVSDEVHENNIETEFASAYALRAVENNPSWRIVFASATPDSKMTNETYELINGGPIPVVEVKGRPHDLEMRESPNQDVVDAYLSANAGVQKSMIFVEGKRRIDEVITELKKRQSSAERNFTRYYKLHADISERARHEIFNMRLRPGEKAVIVSTSAGQSGITIPGLGLVIASGITKTPELDHENAEGLPTRHCTKAELTQQAGRAGRDISGGKFILARPIGFNRSKNRNNSLYDFLPLDERGPDMPPEIYHSNISRNVLATAALGEDFYQLNKYLKNSVKMATIREAYDVLNKLGATTDGGENGTEKITDIGLIMDQYPLRPELSRAIAETYTKEDVSLDLQAYALLIAAAIEAGGLADYDRRGHKWTNSLRATTDDDFIAQLDMMMATRADFYGRSVDEDNLIDKGFSIRRTYRAHRQFDKMCSLIGLDPRDIDMKNPTPDEEEEIKSLFLVGMPDLVYRKVATDRGVGKYENVWGHEQAIRREISDRSVMSLMGQVAVGLVAGYPRWYVKDSGERKDIIDIGFVTSPSQIKNVLGHLATGQLKPEIRNGQLVKTGAAAIGSLSLGQVKIDNHPVENRQDAHLMAGYLMAGDFPALTRLRSLNISEQDIYDYAFKRSYGIYSVGELDAKLWPLVAEIESAD